jgi:hypothetical protein
MERRGFSAMATHIGPKYCSTMKRRKWMWWLAIPLVLVGVVIYYIRTHPLVFNESFFEHAHCIVLTLQALRIYAEDHGGKYPAHTNGYGDALLLMWEQAVKPEILTGPGYSATPIRLAHENNRHLPESECGRVYVQGLNDNMNQGIAIIFDKLLTPGGDHTHLLDRLGAKLAREVGYLDGSRAIVTEESWPAFSKKQIELLVEAGIPRAEAERLYAQVEKR